MGRFTLICIGLSITGIAVGIIANQAQIRLQRCGCVKLTKVCNAVMIIGMSSAFLGAYFGSIFGIPVIGSKLVSAFVDQD